jgi:hypothetical protein
MLSSKYIFKLLSWFITLKMIEELDLEMDSFVRTAKGGVLVLAKDATKNKTYKLRFTKSDYEWLTGKE